MRCFKKTNISITFNSIRVPGKFIFNNRHKAVFEFPQSVIISHCCSLSPKSFYLEILNIWDNAWNVRAWQKAVQSNPQQKSLQRTILPCFRKRLNFAKKICVIKNKGLPLCMAKSGVWTASLYESPRGERVKQVHPWGTKLKENFRLHTSKAKSISL